MRSILFLTILLLGQTFAASAQIEKYSRVTIAADAALYIRLQNLGLAVDHVHRHGNSLVAELSETELNLMRTAGISFTVEIDDLQKYYEERSKNDLAQNPMQRQQLIPCGEQNPADTVQVPANFTLGTMGGFFKYTEMLAHLDNMAALYPNLITIRDSIPGHQTIQGRPIYWVKISDNPTQNEVATEPQVLYDAVHHAREPMSMAQTIFYMYYLLENYSTNAIVKDIVDNTELFFVPCLNPDGYIYNQTIAPNGGGMWRKNRRMNGGGSFGVDLNRNYGYLWGYDNQGSSPVPTTEVYRGTGPFSEPETQAMKAFCESHQFRNALNAHSFGNVFIHPFGYDFDVYPPPADSARFVQFAELMTKYNRYGFGTTPQVLGYLGNGDSDAWMYGEQTTKPEIFSFTPETGNQDDGFWPLPSRIIPLAQGMFHANLNLALLARKLILADLPVSAMLPSTSGNINSNLRNMGLQSGGAVTVSLQSASPYVTSTGAPVVFANLPDLISTPASISYQLNPAVPENTAISMQLVVAQGASSWVYPFERVYYTSPAVYANQFNNDQGLSLTSWDITGDEFYSSSTSVTDSPFGAYDANSVNSMLINQPIDLTNATDAFVTFWTKWEIERGWDFAQVLAVTSAGDVPLCGRYSKPGSGPFQPFGQPLYDGRQPVWIEEKIDLQDFLGQQIQLRFDMTSDDFTHMDGIYIDDLEVHVISPNSIGDELAKADIMLGQAYPNPASATVSVAYNVPFATAQAVLKITDVLGRQVVEHPLTELNGIAKIDIQGLQAGVYTYRVVAGNQKSEARRLVVVK